MWNFPIVSNPAVRLPDVGSHLSSVAQHFQKQQQMQQQEAARQEQLKMAQQRMEMTQAAQQDNRQFRNKSFDATQDYRNRQLTLQEQRIAQAGQPGPTTYGKTGAIFQGPDGNFYSAQFGSDGKRIIKRVEVDGKPLSPAKGVGEVDTADGTEIINRATGQPVRVVPKNLAEAERKKLAGRNQGKLDANKTNATVSAASQIQQGQNVLELTDRALKQATPFTTGIRGVIGRQIPGSEATNLDNTLNTIKANIGFDKLQSMRDLSPTGGALGQVSELELKMLQSVWGSVEQAQTVGQLRANLQRFKSQYRRSMANIKVKYELQYGKGSWKGVDSIAHMKTSPTDDLSKMSNEELLKRLKAGK